MTRYIDEHRARFGVELICRALGVSASAYYQRATGARSARSVEDERLLGVIRDTHKANCEAYGYRRTWKALRRAGETAPRCQVQRLMAEHGIRGANRRGKPWRTTKPDPAAQRPRDLVCRDFTAPAPNRLWVGDFTYLRCWEGVVYFSFVIDVFSRLIVGWQLAGNMRTDLVLDAQAFDEMAGERLAVVGPEVLGLQDRGNLAFGVIVEEAIDLGDQGGGGFALLADERRERQREAGGLPAAEADVERRRISPDSRPVRGPRVVRGVLHRSTGDHGCG